MQDQQERANAPGTPLRWKILQATGALLIVGAVIMCTLGLTLAQRGPEVTTLPSNFAMLAAIGLVLGFVGLPLYLAGRVAASASRR